MEVYSFGYLSILKFYTSLLLHTGISFLHNSSLQKPPFHHCTFSFITFFASLHDVTLKQALDWWTFKL